MRPALLFSDIRVFLFHYEICETDALSLHPLLFEHPVALLLEKGPCRDGGVGGELRGRGAALEGGAERRRDAPALKVLSDVKAVEIAPFVHIPKARDFAVNEGDEGAVLKERGVPL